jgi:Mn2+/Fe2+ NRAMP family transporter
MQEFARKPVPKRPGFLVMLGPGSIWMALAQGSGELIWWPYIIAKYGLAFLFLLLPACLLQFPLSFEIGRYTILTEEGIFRGFFRLNRWYGAGLWLLFTISFFWFGAFATAGGTAIARLTNFPADWQPRSQTLFWAQGSIVLFTLALLYAKTAYLLIEWVMKFVAGISIIGMVVACSHPQVSSHLGEFLSGLFWIDLQKLRQFEAADAEQLLTAISFAGLGGF